MQSVSTGCGLVLFIFYLHKHSQGNAQTCILCFVTATVISLSHTFNLSYKRLCMSVKVNTLLGYVFTTYLMSYADLV